jgi:hypothetical protein
MAAGKFVRIQPGTGTRYVRRARAYACATTAPQGLAAQLACQSHQPVLQRVVAEASATMVAVSARLVLVGMTAAWCAPMAAMGTVAGAHSSDEVLALPLPLNLTCPSNQQLVRHLAWLDSDDEGRCLCEPGFWGARCSVRSECPNACSARGHCAPASDVEEVAAAADAAAEAAKRSVAAATAAVTAVSTAQSLAAASTRAAISAAIAATDAAKPRCHCAKGWQSSADW